MGVFDSNQANRKYHNAVPNYDVDDGVDIVPCVEDCPYKDEDKGRCAFETCIMNQFPLSTPYHTSTVKSCTICGEKSTVTFDEFDIPIVKLASFICDNCRSKIRTLITGDDSND